MGRATGDGGSARDLFVRAAEGEADLPGGRFVLDLREELERLAGRAQQTGSLAELHRATQDWGTEETDRYRKLSESAQDHAQSGGAEQEPAGGVRALAQRAALEYAPLGLVAGAWLQWLSSPANADDPATLRVLALYASDIGAGHPRASRGAAYLTLMRHLRVAENAAPTSRIALDQRITDRAFYLPALLLGMSRRPDDFRAELLGADLCLRSVGLPPVLEAVAPGLPAAFDRAALDLSVSRTPELPGGLAQCREAVDALLAEGAPGVQERLLLGFRWALAALRRWSEELFEELRCSLDPAFGMAELLRRRAREGSVYHHDFELAGRSLSGWLTECRTDPEPFMAVLAASRLVKPGRAGSSALVNGLIGERGPMFRVFSPEDLTVVRRWIDALPAEASTGGRTDSSGLRLALIVPPVDESLTGKPSDARAAYHLLLTRNATPALRRYAVDWVNDWLGRARHGLDRTEMPLPAAWDPQGLRPWLVEQHERHGQEFEDSAEVPLPSREELIDSTVQLAPLTLIDGSWLQGFTDYEHASSEIGFSLFETYWDELGNGEARLNHPLIYREVLAEMGVQVPPTASPEFAGWTGFRDSSFELPVYWLSIGRFPQSFMPEVLGLNLAMELSGVGGTYRRARIALKEYGFSTRFVDIHNTIDNVATGHSAWAADAVDTYLSTVLAAQGGEAQAAAWERVRAGYRSLNPPSGFRARRAGRRARLARSAR